MCIAAEPLIGPLHSQAFRAPLEPLVSTVCLGIRMTPVRFSKYPLNQRRRSHNRRLAMANHAPCFFLAPTWDYPPPPVGPIKLGSVIASVKIPERALFTAPIPSDSAAFSSSQHKVSFSTEKLRENKYGVFTKFLSPFVGAGVDAALNWDKR